jgi:hypothetical protein
VVKLAAGKEPDVETCTVMPSAVPPTGHTVTWNWASWPTSTLSVVPWTVTQSWVTGAFPLAAVVVAVALGLGLGLGEAEPVGLGLGEGLDVGGGVTGAGSAWHAVFPDD